MLSKTEREYIENPIEFEKKHPEGYVRKIRNHIRLKVVLAITDLIDIHDLDHKEFGRIENDLNSEHAFCKSILGRKRKSLIDCFGNITLDGFNSFNTMNQKEYNVQIESMRENMKYAWHKLFIDTKFGKHYMNTKQKSNDTKK